MQPTLEYFQRVIERDRFGRFGFRASLTCDFVLRNRSGNRKRFSDRLFVPTWAEVPISAAPRDGKESS
jgi:hypothetical protein